jgi:hypothetical protein
MLATIAAAVLGTQELTSAPLVLVAYVVSLSSCVVWWLLTAGVQSDRRLPDVMAGLRPRAPAAAPPPRRVVELERVVTVGMSSALDADARLRPALRGLARDLLAVRGGVEIAEDDDVAALAGLPGEPLLGPPSARPPSATAPGASAADIARVLAHLESVLN